ncbi:hypothetical protein SXCC_02847 [Gluconacetobacter sp. SXCC-1]|nr:hypothetical protein SXCC_02847 [Gluconacetobacter sp. SXCC-1]
MWRHGSPIPMKIPVLPGAVLGEQQYRWDYKVPGTAFFRTSLTRNLP